MPEDDLYQRPDGFDLDGGWSQGADPTIEQIAAEYEWENWRDVIAADGFFDSGDVRPGSYHSIEDAIKEAYNVGILDWSEFLYDPVDDEWYIIVDY